MVEGRAQSDWGRVSSLMALIANVNRDPKKTRPYRPDDFNPTLRAEQKRRPTAPISVLKDVFIRQGTKEAAQ